MPDNEFEGLHAEISTKVIRFFYQVANELGPGFLESVYHNAMLIALREAGLRYEEQVGISVSFHRQSVGVFYADIVVEGKVILELKTANELTKAALSQLTNYLRATSIEVGLLLAFGEEAKFRRLIFTNDRKRLAPEHPY